MNIVDQDGSLKKKQRQTRRETKLKEKELLKPLVTCSEYPTSDQIRLEKHWEMNGIRIRLINIYLIISIIKTITMNKFNNFTLNKIKNFLKFHYIKNKWHFS